MSKHTPGPWFAVGGWVEVERDDIADICSCCPEDFGQEHIGRDHKEVMANARLIAAAPELVEMARTFMNYFGGDHEDAILAIAEDGSTLTQVQALARAAIAKAEGK